MEARHGLCIIAAALAFGSASLLVLHLGARGNRSTLRLLPRELGVKDTAFARLLRNGIGPLRGIARMLIRWKRASAVLERMRMVAMERGFAASEESLASVLLLMVALLSLVAFLAANSPVAALAVAVLAVAAGVAWTNHQADARADALRSAVPDALRSMEACFQSGFSLMQTLAQVASETKGSLSGLFSHAAHVLQAGGTSAEALRCLRQDQDLPELAFVSVALDVQHQTGGSMRKCLESAIDMVEGELSLRRSLRVQTAQARLSARVVSVMPFALIALFSLISEGFLEPFFASAVGMALLTLAFAMQAAGILIVRRMLKVG